MDGLNFSDFYFNGLAFTPSKVIFMGFYFSIFIKVHTVNAGHTSVSIRFTQWMAMINDVPFILSRPFYN